MDSDNTFLNVVECFTSIQGESTHAGRVCFFIRLAGCNLECSYCDTKYAQTPGCGKQYSLTELLALAQASGTKLVEITGGEPALQPETPLLAELLLDNGFEVLMETNGSVRLDSFPRQLKRIIDVKLPSSGMNVANDPENYRRLHDGDELKFVVGSREDFEYALAWIDRCELDKKAVPLIFSPVFGAVQSAELAEWILQSKRDHLRMQLQMHKYIWHPDRRGV